MIGRLSEISKRIIFAVALIAAAAALTGCGASLTVYDYTEDGVRYNAYELALDGDTQAAMERSAIADGNGNKYTVSGYFTELFDDFGYDLESATFYDGVYKLRYKKAVGGDGELFESGSKVEFKVTHSENGFVRNYTAISPDPFNGVRKAYDEVLPMRSDTLLERLKNGMVAHDEYGDTVVYRHALDEAFPYLKGADLDGLLLNYVRYGSKRMSSSGRSADIDGKNAMYTFSRYFDRTERTIRFDYRRAVPYGWYTVALAAGGVTFAVILLVTRTKKQKPTLLDRFPYNPEEYRDYESHLPANL